MEPYSHMDGVMLTQQCWMHAWGHGRLYHSKHCLTGLIALHDVTCT